MKQVLLAGAVVLALAAPAYAIFSIHGNFTNDQGNSVMVGKDGTIGASTKTGAKMVADAKGVMMMMDKAGNMAWIGANGKLVTKNNAKNSAEGKRMTQLLGTLDDKK